MNTSGEFISWWSVKKCTLFSGNGSERIGYYRERHIRKWYGPFCWQSNNGPKVWFNVGGNSEWNDDVFILDGRSSPNHYRYVTLFKFNHVCFTLFWMKMFVIAKHVLFQESSAWLAIHWASSYCQNQTCVTHSTSCWLPYVRQIQCLQWLQFLTLQ